MKKKRRLLQSDTFWGIAATVLVLLQFWWLPGEDGSAADSYSTTVDGKLALFRTLSELFPQVERDALNAVPTAPATMILIAPDRYPTDQEEQKLYEFVRSGGDLLFAPNWMRWNWLDGGKPPEVRMARLGIHLKFRVEQNSAVPTAAVIGTPAPAAPVTQAPGSEAPAPEGPIAEAPGAEDSDTAAASGTPSSSTVPAGPRATAADDAIESENEITATGSLVDAPVNFQSTSTLILPTSFTTETLLTSSRGDVEAATWQLGSGRVLVCSSADLFSNRSMLYKESRRLAVRLVERCANNAGTELDLRQSSVIINEYFNASDSFRSTGVLFSPSLRTGTLQLLLVAILAVWMAFHRFGPAAEVTSVQRRSLIESAQAVGNLQYRLNDGGAVVRGYLEYISSQLRRRYGSFLRLDQHELIANRSGMDADEVRTQLREAQLMAESSHVSAARAASMLRWLARLQQRLSGSRFS